MLWCTLICHFITPFYSDDDIAYDGKEIEPSQGEMFTKFNEVPWVTTL